MALSKIVSSSLANGSVSIASITDNTVTSAKLTSTGVVANSYGNTTAIPVITVDAQGRITNATTSSVSGVTGLSFTPANSTVTVSTSTTNFDAVVTSGNSTVQGLLKVIDSVSNTSTSIAASANSVTTAYQLAANAVSNATAYAATAYSNAVATAASDATTKAGTAYSNATSYADTAAGTAYSNAISYANTAAGTAYSNAVATAASDATTKAGTAYSNAVATAASDATTKAGTAYSNAISYANTVAYTAAGTAYTNAVATAASDATTKAGTAYSNAISYANTIAYTAADTAYANAVTYANTKANAAYSNVFNGGTFSGAVVMQANLTANSVRLNGDLQIDGNLTVSGNTVSIQVTNLSVEDNMILLNSNSTITNPDLGFAGNYNDGSYAHAGLFRDATDGVWKFFHGYTPEPDASLYIDTSNSSFTLSNLQINYVIGNVTGSANSATYLGGNTAATLRSYSDTMAGTAYSNATTYAATIAGTAYSNAVSVAASDATTKAGTAYSNATTYAATIAGTAYSNAVSIAASDATTKAGTAYSNATTYAATIAGTAYSNAVSVAASDATTKAGTAYSNATTYAATIAGTAYSNATSYAATIAGTAYSNAVAYAASNSYVNSTFLKLTGGSLTGNVATSAYIHANGTGGATGGYFGMVKIGYGANYGTIERTDSDLYLQVNNAYNVVVGSGGGYLTATNSSRAPIFYDSNDTTYYVDPNSRSVLSSLNVGSATTIGTGKLSVFAGGAGAVGWATGFNLGDASNYTTWIQDAGVSRFRNTGTGGMDWYNSAGGTQIMSLSDAGNLIAPAGSMRAPIFYDSDNTAYYTNPNGTSNLVGLTVANTISGSITGTAGAVSWPNVISGARTDYNLGFQAPSSGWAGLYFLTSTGAGAGYLLVRGTSDSWPPYTTEGITLVTDANSLNLFARGTTVAGGNAWVRMGTGSSETFRLMGDYSYSLNSSRAPIFYDSNDTGYYLDPNTTSDSALRIRGGALHGPNVTWSTYLLVGGDGRQNYTNSTNTASVCSTNGNLHMDAASGYDMFLNYYDGGNIYFGSGGNSIIGTVTSAGNLTMTGNITAYSDRKLKTNIKTIQNAIDIVSRLRGVYFDWIESGQQSIGLIAQEAQEVVPELVLENVVTLPPSFPGEEMPEDRVLSVDYGKITSILIEAIKEQQKLIETLAEKVKVLESK